MRPRERYTLEGPDPFGPVELLALVLGTGAAGRPAPAIAAELLETFGGLAGIAQAPPAALARVPGVGPARAVRIHAACQLGRRVAPAPPRRVTCPSDAAAVLAPRLGGLPHEELHALYVDRGGRLLAVRRLTTGNDRSTIVDPRQALRPAVACGAGALILGHNHPGGSADPSPEDLAVTRRVGEAADLLGCVLLDHLIVAGDGSRWTSLAERGHLPRSRAETLAWSTG